MKDIWILRFSILAVALYLETDFSTKTLWWMHDFSCWKYKLNHLTADWPHQCWDRSFHWKNVFKFRIYLNIYWYFIPFCCVLPCGYCLHFVAHQIECWALKIIMYNLYIIGYRIFSIEWYINHMWFSTLNRQFDTQPNGV